MLKFKSLRNYRLNKNKMGCSFTYSQQLKNYTERTADGRTLNQIMKTAMEFDFNKDKKEGETTFEEKLRRKITNELGNLMVPTAVEVIVIQFRKFIAFTAYELLNRKEKYVNPKPELQGYFESDSVWSKSTGEIYFESCFHPPMIVDLVWKSLILNTKIYKDYCYELCGGYIDRVDPLTMSNITSLYFNILIEFY